MRMQAAGDDVPRLHGWAGSGAHRQHAVPARPRPHPTNGTVVLNAALHDLYRWRLAWPIRCVALPPRAAAAAPYTPALCRVRMCATGHALTTNTPPIGATRDRTTPHVRQRNRRPATCRRGRYTGQVYRPWLPWGVGASLRAPASCG